MSESAQLDVKIQRAQQRLALAVFQRNERNRVIARLELALLEEQRDLLSAFASGMRPFDGSAIQRAEAAPAT
jgi:hypothetical protein